MHGKDPWSRAIVDALGCQSYGPHKRIQHRPSHIDAFCEQITTEARPYPAVSSPDVGRPLRPGSLTQFAQDAEALNDRHREGNDLVGAQLLVVADPRTVRPR